jgi:hypothetical protein
LREVKFELQIRDSILNSNFVGNFSAGDCVS